MAEFTNKKRNPSVFVALFKWLKERQMGKAKSILVNPSLQSTLNT